MNLALIMKLYSLVPLCLLVVTVILLVRMAKKCKRCNQCTGTIVRFHETPASHMNNDHGRAILSPIVSYTVSGRSYEFMGKYYSTAMKVGKERTVLYDEEDPAKASLKAGLLAAPMITGAAALFSIIPLVVYAILRSKGILAI